MSVSVLDEILSSANTAGRYRSARFCCCFSCLACATLTAQGFPFIVVSDERNTHFNKSGHLSAIRSLVYCSDVLSLGNF